MLKLQNGDVGGQNVCVHAHMCVLCTNRMQISGQPQVSVIRTAEKELQSKINESLGNGNIVEIIKLSLDG